jgi:hypothetical protein
MEKWEKHKRMNFNNKKVVSKYFPESTDDDLQEPQLRYSVSGQQFQSLSSMHEAVVVSIPGGRGGESSLDVSNILSPHSAGTKTICRIEYERFPV